MIKELPPFRVTPEEWARLHARRYRVWVAALSGGFMLAVMAPLGAYIGFSKIITAAFTTLVILLAPWNHYVTTRDRLRKEKGLPWEEQNVEIDEKGLRTRYESGFEVKVPWSKVQKLRQFSEGMILDLEGRAQYYLPARVVDDEARAIIERSLRTARS